MVRRFIGLIGTDGKLPLFELYRNNKTFHLKTIVKVACSMVHTPHDLWHLWSYRFIKVSACPQRYGVGKTTDSIIVDLYFQFLRKM